MEARMRGAVKSSPTPTPHSPLFTHAGIFFGDAKFLRGVGGVGGLDRC